MTIRFRAAQLYYILLFAHCFALCIPAQADATRDKLLALIRLPGMTSSFQFAYSNLSGYEINTEQDTPKETSQEILASLRKTLHGVVTDALTYYRIGNLCAADKKSIEAVVAFTKSAGLYREQLKSTPSDGAKLADLFLALHQAQRKAERDKAITDAIMRAPNSPQVWDARAQIALAEVNSAISERAESVTEAIVPFRLAALLKQPHAKEKVHEALRLLEEAKAHYDKAVSVAPEDWHGYSDRWLMRPIYLTDFRLLKDALQDKLISEEKAKEVGTEYAQLLLAADGMADLTSAARVSHDEPYALGMAAYFIAIQQMQRKPEEVDFKHGGMLTRLPETDQKTVRELLARLEAMTHSSNHTLAGQSALALGIDQMTLLSPQVARTSVLLAQSLLPDDPNVVESLTATYIIDEKYEDVQTVMKEALRHRESVRWRLFRAKAEVHLEQWKEVEEDVRVALDNEPNNLDVNLAQCAVLLHKANDNAGKLAFSAQVQRTHELFESNVTADQSFSFNYIGGLFYALNGNSTKARNYLKNAQGTDEQNAEVKAVLDLLP